MPFKYTAHFRYLSEFNDNPFYLFVSKNLVHKKCLLYTQRFDYKPHLLNKGTIFHLKQS